MSKPKPFALVLFLTALAGCSTPQSPMRPDGILGRIGRKNKGELIAPKWCVLKFVILSRPLKDPVLNDTLWSVADKQAVPEGVRRELESNGLRVGLISGELPAEAQAMLDAPPPRRIDPVTHTLPDGEYTLVELSASAPQAELLLNRGGRVAGKSYRDAVGMMRVTASQQGESGVSLRIVPELHHGDIKHRVGANQSVGAFAPQQFIFKDSQEEETFRDLAAVLTLLPGQVAVVGSDPDRRHSLGDFLLTMPEVGSDRMLQKVVLIWADRNASPPTEGSSPPAPVLEPVEPPDMPRRSSGANAKAKADVKG